MPHQSAGGPRLIVPSLRTSNSVHRHGTDPPCTSSTVSGGPVRASAPAWVPAWALGSVRAWASGSARASEPGWVQVSGPGSAPALAPGWPSALVSAWGARSVVGYSSVGPSVAASGSGPRSPSALPSASAWRRPSARSSGSRRRSARPTLTETTGSARAGRVGRQPGGVLGGAGVPVTDSTPPAGLRPDRDGGDQHDGEARGREHALAAPTTRGATRRGRRSRRPPGAPVDPACREPSATPPSRRRRAVSGPRPLVRRRHARRASSSACASATRARSARPSARVVVGRPSIRRSRYIPIDASTMSAALARIPGRCACEPRGPPPASRSAVRRSTATATTVAATAMSARTGRSIGMSARC